ncbi:MAG: hypothetical protein WA131_09945 [Desulfitobacteriaceae bacterium]
MNHQAERMVHWVSPLKMGLSAREVHGRIQCAWKQELWKPITYRSTGEVSGKIESPLTAFESTWILKDIIKPDLEPSQKRRPKGSIQTVEIEVRCMFYRHELKADHEKFRRDTEKVKLEGALNEFTLKLNLRKFRELKHCQIKLDERLKAYPNTKRFVQCTLSESESVVISLNWLWDEMAFFQTESTFNHFLFILHKELVIHRLSVTVILVMPIGTGEKNDSSIRM